MNLDYSFDRAFAVFFYNAYLQHFKLDYFLGKKVKSFHFELAIEIPDKEDETLYTLNENTIIVLDFLDDKEEK